MELRKLNFVAILAIALVTGLQADTQVSSDVVKTDIPGIKNFSSLSDSSGFAGPLVGFGGATDPSAIPQLKEKGFKTIVSLRLSTEEGVDIEAGRQAARTAGLNYVHLPLDPPNATQADIQRLLETLGDPTNQAVYMHCGSATRAAAVWMIGRVTEDGWEMDRAQKEAVAIAAKPDDAIAFASSYLSDIE